MKLLLLRHAKAEKRREFDGPDPLRPLTPRGLQQAEQFARSSAAPVPTRILTSPYLRCRQTVAPLANACGVLPESHAFLAKGESPEKAFEQLRENREGTILCCGHAEQLEEVQELAAEHGVAAERLQLAPTDAPCEPDARLAVLDLGSTSFHLLVADVTRAGRLTPLARERRMLRLGAVIASGREIPRDIAKVVLATASELAATARATGAERILPVGTAALRDALNGPELAARIGEEVGAPVRTLSGEEEARLIFAAFQRRVLLPPHAALGVDLGGGSLELAVGDEHGLPFEATFPLGATRLHGEIVTKDPMRRREAREIVDRVTEYVAPLRAEVQRLRPELAVAAGGTARALGHLAVGIRSLRPVASVNQLRLPLDELRSLAEMLVRANHDERLQLPGIRRRRADLLPTGALVLVALAEALELDGYTLCDWGLREGALLEAVGAT